MSTIFYIGVTELERKSFEDGEIRTLDGQIKRTNSTIELETPVFKSEDIFIKTKTIEIMILEKVNSAKQKINQTLEAFTACFSINRIIRELFQLGKMFMEYL